MGKDKGNNPASMPEVEDDAKLTEEDLDELAAEIGVDRESDSDGGGSDDDSGTSDKPAKPPSHDDAAGDDDEDKGARDEAPDDAEDGDDDDDESGSDDGDGADDSDTVGGLTLSELEELGLGKFDSVDKAKKSLRHLRSAVGRQNEDARLGRMVREAREAGLDPAALFQKGDRDDASGAPASKGKGKAPAYDPAWDRQVKPKLDEDGNQVGYEGPAELVAKVEEFHSYRTDLMNRFYRGEQAAMDELFGEMIEQRAKDIAAQSQSSTAMESFMQENGTFLLDNDLEEEFFKLMDNGATPELAVEHLRLKHGKPAAGGKEEESEEDGDDESDKAKNKDLEDLKKRTRGKARTPARPARKGEFDDLDLENMDEEEIAELAIKRAGINLD